MALATPSTPPPLLPRQERSRQIRRRGVSRRQNPPESRVSRRGNGAGIRHAAPRGASMGMLRGPGTGIQAPPQVPLGTLFRDAHQAPQR